jgi:lipopolysaccharide/colanic/teichoic acid biosynthesis glycosyltransferase
LLLAGLLHSAIDVLPNAPDFDPRRYGVVAAGVIPGLLGIFWLRRAYARQNLLGGPEEYARVVSGCTYGVLLVVAASYWYGGLPLVSRGWLLLFWLLGIVLVGGGRFALRRIAYGLRPRGWFVRRVLIAGANDQGLAIAQQLHGPTGRGVEVAGFLDDYLAAGTRVAERGTGRRGEATPNYAVLGHPREAQALAADLQADLLILVPQALSWESQQSLAHLSETVSNELEVRIAPTGYDLTSAQLRPAPLGFVPLVQLVPIRAVGLEALLRRIVDVGLAALLAVVMAPSLAWALVGARLRGVGPILVSERVLGRCGQPVTLRLLSPRVSERLLLRGLPALEGVLRGRLALVGPRPIPVAEQAEYRRWAGLLLTVQPGLTGPWRLAGPTVSTEERVLADVWWVRNWSIWQHLFVLFKTAQVVGTGAWGQQGPARWETRVRAPASVAARVRALPGSGGGPRYGLRDAR